MQIIPLVRAKYVHAYGAVLERLGAPRRRMLERAGLSERMLENPETVLPANQVWGFIGSSAVREGIDDFGLLAGEMSIADYGEFSQRLLQTPNLKQALSAFCPLALHEYSRADFYVSRSRGATWFCRGPIEGNDHEKKHVELLVLTMMIATVGLVAQVDWRPPIVFLQTKDSRRVESHHLLSRSIVRFGNRITAFEIPEQLLAKQLPQEVLTASGTAYDRLDHEFPNAIRKILEGMLANGTPKIATVADATGVSVRTLQRRLSESELTFSGILEEERMKLATRMLVETDCQLKEIARELGYSDLAHFTRAFHRWFGVSPRVYRQLNT